MPTLIYCSTWSPIKPLVYSDDSQDRAVNSLIDNIFRVKTHRLIMKNGKYYYCPSEEYKQFIAKMKKSR